MIDFAPIDWLLGRKMPVNLALVTNPLISWLVARLHSHVGEEEDMITDGSAT
jgi:hypothetical protein